MGIQNPHGKSVFARGDKWVMPPFAVSLWTFVIIINGYNQKIKRRMLDDYCSSMSIVKVSCRSTE